MYNSTCNLSFLIFVVFCFFTKKKFFLIISHLLNFKLSFTAISTDLSIFDYPVTFFCHLLQDYSLIWFKLCDNSHSNFCFLFCNMYFCKNRTFKHICHSFAQPRFLAFLVYCYSICDEVLIVVLLYVHILLKSAEQERYIKQYIYWHFIKIISEGFLRRT